VFTFPSAEAPPVADDLFPDLIRRVRAGDQAAATELVRRYEPAIRRAVRVRLVDNRLRRQLDSMDVCQSVLASFFVRAALGQFELDHSEQLLKLLATMVRNKVSDAADRHGADRRDFRRATAGLDQAAEAPAAGGTPSRQFAARELLDEARRRLTDDERQLLDLRGQGHEWEEVAAEVGGTPEALRKKLARAIDRVTQELGLEDLGSG
jgi:RNA polymerase sigma-70 factor (ECF subfamily)